MATFQIRGMDDDLYWALKVKAAQEGVSLKALVVPMLELLMNSKPVEKKSEYSLRDEDWENAKFGPGRA